MPTEQMLKDMTVRRRRRCSARRKLWRNPRVLFHRHPQSPTPGWHGGKMIRWQQSFRRLCGATTSTMRTRSSRRPRRKSGVQSRRQSRRRQPRGRDGTMHSVGAQCPFDSLIRAAVEGVALKLLPIVRPWAAMQDEDPRVVLLIKRAPAVVGAASGPLARRAGIGAGHGPATAERGAIRWKG